jgi:hypothetical protein
MKVNNTIVHVGCECVVLLENADLVIRYVK